MGIKCYCSDAEGESYWRYNSIAENLAFIPSAENITRSL